MHNGLKFHKILLRNVYYFFQTKHTIKKINNIFTFKWFFVLLL